MAKLFHIFQESVGTLRHLKHFHKNKNREHASLKLNMGGRTRGLGVRMLHYVSWGSETQVT